MLAILIEILTEIPLQKQHIMRQLKAQNTKKIQYIKDNIKDCKLLTKRKILVVILSNTAISNFR